MVNVAHALQVQTGTIQHSGLALESNRIFW